MAAAGARRGRGQPARHHRRCEDCFPHRQQPAWRAGGRRMPQRAGVKKPRKSISEQVTLEFSDNKLLAALSGPHEKNFARLEQKLDLRVTQRGNRIGIAGAARGRGAAILSSLYARAEAGESITLAEVDAEIRFTDAGRAETPGAVRTAAGRLTRPRSPAQSAYLDLM